MEIKRMTTVLITGANGFIGSHLVSELHHRGYKVRALVRHTSDLTSLKCVPAQLYIGDVTQPETLVEAVRDVDYIYHLAAALLPPDTEVFLEVNTEGTYNILQTAECYAPNLKRFLFVSSQAAAGPGKDATPLTESHTPAPISNYGISKKLAEEAVLSYAQQFSITIVRPSSVYGERERDLSSTFGLIESRIQPVLGLQEIKLVMVYVKDLVKGIVCAAESPHSEGKTYFLNHPEILTAKQVPQTIAAVMGKPTGLPLRIPHLLPKLMAPIAEWQSHLSRQRPSVTRDKARELSQRYWVADPGQAEADFGWRAGHNLASGMIPTIAHYRHQQEESRAMPLEKRPVLWAKYLIVASGIGLLIEILSATGRFYSFNPAWVVLLIIFGAFGAGLGTLAMLLRERPATIQFLVGMVVTAAAELLNEFNYLPFDWHFSPGWPLGITDPVGRPLFLGLAGGIFILAVNAILRSLYQRRLRLG
jgi:nucleoside-diphosphate-sugar epimerase